MKLLPIWARLCLLISLVLALPSIALAAGPTITAQPQPVYVNQGASTTLSVTATASSTITYQWELNSNSIPGANSASLTISNAQSNEGGTYDVVVTAGGISITSAQVQVSIVLPPSFLTPSSTTVTAIKGTYFQVYTNSSGSSPITYSWKKDGTVVTGQNNYYFSDLATSSSAGTYVLTATNSAGTANSASFVVTVVDPIVVTLTSTQTVAGGSNVTLTPTVTGPGPLTYQWSSPTQYYAGTGATLTLTNVSASDAGYYSLSVSNPYQYGVSASTNLIVTAPPVITTQPTNLTATSGSYSSLYVSTQGSGTLTYQWSKGGVVLPNSNRISGATSGSLNFYPIIDSDAGTYTVTVTNDYGSTTSTSAVITVTANSNGPSITTEPASVTAIPGSTADFSVVATGGTLTYQWFKGGQLISGATASTFSIANVSQADAADYTVQVTNQSSTVTSTTATLTLGVAAVLPVITQQPQNQSANVGGSVTLTAAASGTPAPTFQWQKNGTNIAGATGTSLALTNVQTTDSGSYAILATNAAGSAVSSAATVTVTALPQTRVINLSTRAQVGTGEDILIAGFIINGSTSKKMLIRAVGPTLSQYGVTHPLADPSLKIVDGGGNTVATNNDWGTSTNLDEYNAANTKVGAVAFPAGSKDSGLVVTLAPGGYTALVSGGGATGVALVELYEVDTDTPNQLINISSRANVSTGDGVAIAGIIVSGSTPKKFLVRAIGPGLAARGVKGFLADPTFQIVDSATSNPIATNDNWETSDTLADTKAISTQLGVSPLDTGSKDSALTVTLAPGGYTVVVRGVNGTSGVALVELYQVP